MILRVNQFWVGLTESLDRWVDILNVLLLPNCSSAWLADLLFRPNVFEFQFIIIRFWWLKIPLRFLIHWCRQSAFLLKERIFQIHVAILKSTLIINFYQKPKTLQSTSVINPFIRLFKFLQRNRVLVLFMEPRDWNFNQRFYFTCYLGVLFVGDFVLNLNHSYIQLSNQFIRPYIM